MKIPAVKKVYASEETRLLIPTRQKELAALQPNTLIEIAKHCYVFSIPSKIVDNFKEKTTPLSAQYFWFGVFFRVAAVRLLPLET